MRAEPPGPASATTPPLTTSNWSTCTLNAGWLNRIEAQFTGPRYFALGGTDHATHKEQGRAIRSYISCRNRNPHDRSLRKVVDRANVGRPALAADGPAIA